MPSYYIILLYVKIEIEKRKKRKTGGDKRVTLSYQREVDKGKLTSIASFEKLTFRA